jgi:Carboxypeptidase regulatory-like domain
MNRMLCVGLLAFTACTAWAQEPVAVPPASTASLQGIVQQKGENNPVWGAAVELRKEGSNVALYGALTGADGKWAFPTVPAGRYRLITTCPGYVSAEYGQRRMNGPGLPIILSVGQQMSDVRVEMVPTGAISGRITDPSGQPIAFADVFALKSSYQEGERLLTPVLSAKTDDRGDFRIFWITPATYYLAVIAADVNRPLAPLIMNADGRDTFGTAPLIRTIPREVLSASSAGGSETYAPIYFANTHDVRQAQYIDVLPGSDIKGVDITVVPTRTFEVSGIVTNSVTGQFPGSPTTMLAILPFDPFGAPNGNFVNAQTGKFQMKGVVPGRYMLYAAPNDGRGVDDPTAIWGGMEVEVRDQNIDNLNIVAKHGVALSGKVIVEGLSDAAGVAPPSGLYIAIRPQPLIGTRAPSTIAKVSPDGSFSLPGIIEGIYRAYVLPLLNPANPDLMNVLRTSSLQKWTFQSLLPDCKTPT